MLRAALALLGLLVAALVGGQFVLPRIAERRISDSLAATGEVRRVSVEALPAVKLLFKRADRVEIDMAEARAGTGPLAQLLRRTDGARELDARVDLVRVGPLQLRGVALRKDHDDLQRRGHGQRRRPRRRAAAPARAAAGRRPRRRARARGVGRGLHGARTALRPRRRARDRARGPARRPRLADPVPRLARAGDRGRLEARRRRLHADRRRGGCAGAPPRRRRARAPTRACAASRAGAGGPWPSRASGPGARRRRRRSPRSSP